MSYTIFEAPPSYVADEQQGHVLDVKQRESVIRTLVEEIRQHHDGRADHAVREIYEILSAEFPSIRYHASLQRGNLKRHLRAALQEHRPLVIAFTPKHLDRREAYYCTTHFVELAGYSAWIESLFPSIETFQQGVWRAPGDHLEQPLEVPPFGQVEHQWRCAPGPWRGANLILSYLCCYGPQRKRLNVHCTTRLPG